LGFSSCSSWNLYGWKDNLIRSTLHTVMWEISPSSPAWSPYLNQTLSERWIGHGGYIPWPPNPTPMDFSFWRFVKDNVYIPPMPVDHQELRDRIVNAIALVRVTFLGKLWVELEYRLDVCHITRGCNIEHL
jgi:hypothetical protein